MSDDECRPRLMIVGGGLTGAALAIEIMRTTRAPLDLTLVEPAEDIGRGVAYGTVDPVHRINVPTHRLSLCRDRPDDFTRWLFARGILPDAASTDDKGEHYVPRSSFGTYARDTLETTVAQAGQRVTFRHLRARVVALERQGAGWSVTLDDGRQIEADGVALCPGHPAPILPCRVSATALQHPGLVANPWGRGVYERIGPNNSVLIVGTGLTMLDALASLDRAGHRGPVVAISRRGLLARPQGSFRDGFDPFADAPQPRTALGLLRLLRQSVADHAEAEWQEVLDGFRLRLKRLWAALPPSEQRRVARRLLPFWDVHRFRAAPQLHSLAEEWRRESRLGIMQAGLAGLDADADGLRATLALPGDRRESRSFDAVVLCTGPGNALRTDPLIGDLLVRGLARADGVGFGLSVDASSRMITPDGTVQDRLWAFGPVTRGSFGEMTGAPDIVKHIGCVVPELIGAFRAHGTADEDRTSIPA